MKTCKICQIEKDLNQFHKSKTGRCGRVAVCKPCRSSQTHEERKENYFVHYVRTKKSECKRKEIPFDLTPQYLEDLWTGVCPVFGTEMQYGMKGRGSDHLLSAHLDRIDPSKGYVVGNVCWISGRANRIKYDATIEELKQIINYMRR